MQPFAHARITAHGSGRDWLEDLPIHEFMDLAKHACPDLRHRLVLHNRDLGPELAAMAFPARKDAGSVALAHVAQDLGWAPPLEAWLERSDPARLPRSRRDPEAGAEIVESARAHHRLKDPEPVRAVWALLTLPLRFAPRHPLAGALLMSSLGPILARTVLGPPRAFPRTDGGEALVDFAWVAEGMIVAHSGSIPSLERVLACHDGREPPNPRLEAPAGLEQDRKADTQLRLSPPATASDAILSPPCASPSTSPTRPAMSERSSASPPASPFRST